MILDICGGESSKVSIVGNLKSNIKSIDLNNDKFSNVIGFSITPAETNKILSSLGCKVKVRKKKY